MPCRSLSPTDESPPLSHRRPHHADATCPAPPEVAEAAGLFLRGAYFDAHRVLDSLLRRVQDAGRRASAAGSPSGSGPLRGTEAASAPDGAGVKGASGPPLTDDDAAAVLLIAGFSHLFAMADAKWARGIGLLLTDRYPMFTLGFVLRAEAEAATGDFIAAFRLLARVERDLVAAEPLDRPLYSALAVPSRPSSPGAMLGDSQRTSGTRLYSGDDDDESVEVIGFTCAPSAVFIRAVWLHVVARRVPEDERPDELRTSPSGAISSAQTPGNDRRARHKATSAHPDAAEIELLKRYAAEARIQLQAQQAAWGRFRAVVAHARVTGAVVHPCSKCGAAPNTAAESVAPPSRWACPRCSKPAEPPEQQALENSLLSRRSASSASLLQTSLRSPPSATGTTATSAAGTKRTGGSSSSAKPLQATPTMPMRSTPRGPAAAAAAAAIPADVAAGRTPGPQDDLTPRTPAGSFQFFRLHCDGNATPRDGQHAISSPRLPPPAGTPTARSSSVTERDGVGGDAASTASFLALSRTSSFASTSAPSSPHGGGKSRGASGRVWAPDSLKACQRCARKVGRMTRHHCRSCGRLVCGPCSGQRRPVPILGFPEPSRVCSNCADVLDANAKQQLQSPALVDWATGRSAARPHTPSASGAPGSP